MKGTFFKIGFEIENGRVVVVRFFFFFLNAAVSYRLKLDSLTPAVYC